MIFVALPLRNLSRRPLRSVLSVLGIALAVGGAIALVALSRSINESVRLSVDELGSDLTVMQRGNTDVFGAFLPASIEARFAAVPGVAAVTGELMMFAPIDRSRESLVAGWPDHSFFWQVAPIGQGARPRPGDRRVAMLGDSAAEALGKSVGDSIEILGVTFRVVAINKYATAINRRLIVVPLADLQEVAFRGGQVTLFQVRLARGAGASPVDEVRRRIEALAPVTASPTNAVLDNNRYVATLNAVALATSAIAIVIGALNVLNTLLFAVQERTREIGILCAIGWTDRRIMISIVIEGLILCGFGSAAGIVLGMLGSVLFASVPVIGDYLSFSPTLDLIVPAIAAAVALCLIGSLYPAWRAVRMTPAEALRRA